MSSIVYGTSGMSDYEVRAWEDLNEFWQRKAKRRAIPPRVSQGMASGTAKVKSAADKAGSKVRDFTPESVKNLGGAAFDRTLEPTVQAMVGLLETVTETVQKLTDVDTVLNHHRKMGRGVDGLGELRPLDLKYLDEVTRNLTLQSRLTGVMEGGAIGALAFVPVAGSVAAIGADLVVMHALSTAIATRAAHAYGIDPATEAERHHLERMLRRVWAAQAPKASTVNGARNAFEAGANRVRWSDKFRKDHRIAAALESLLKQTGTGNHVPIEKVITKLPAIAVVTSAGINSAVLGSLARTSVRYGQTIHLSTKYELELPTNLTTF